MGGWPGGLEAIDWALDAEGAAVEDVGVDHGRADVSVAEEGLDGSEVGAVLEEMGCEGVAEGVGGDALVNLGSDGGSADGSLDSGFVEVVSPSDSGSRIGRESGGGEDPLPAPFTARFGQLAFERVGKFDARCMGTAVAFVEGAHALEVAGDRIFEGFREECGAITVSLAFADDELTSAGVEVLDAQA